MQITIRRAAASDAEIVARHNCSMAAETEDLQLDAARVLEGTRAVLDDPLKGFYLLAEADTKVAGQLMVTFEWSDWRNGVFWWMQSVYVRPEYRRLGIYRALYHRLLSEAHAAGDVCGIRLYVDRENRTAQAVYGRLGLRKTRYDLYEADFVIPRD